MLLLLATVPAPARAPHDGEPQVRVQCIGDPPVCNLLIGYDCPDSPSEIPDGAFYLCIEFGEPDIVLVESPPDVQAGVEYEVQLRNLDVVPFHCANATAFFDDRSVDADTCLLGNKVEVVADDLVAHDAEDFESGLQEPAFSICPADVAFNLANEGKGVTTVETMICKHPI